MDGERDEISAPTGSEATRLIRELAERQHGLVARRQLLAAGLGKGLVQERVRGGLLAPVHRGVYAVGHRRTDLRHRWMAAVLACGRDAVLSHASAAHLWGLRGSRERIIQVTRRSGGTRRAGIRVMQALSVSRRDRTLEAAIPVTTIERTLLDCAAVLDSRQLERLVVAADRSARLRWDELQRVIREGEGRTGIARLRQVVAAVDPGAVEVRSGVEVDFLALCRDAGLPTPAVNVLVDEALVDFLWASQRVIVEVDSYRFHGDRSAFERDRSSTLVLTAAGYEVLRITERMLARDPERFLGLVRRSLCRAARAGAR